MPLHTTPTRMLAEVWLLCMRMCGNFLCSTSTNPIWSHLPGSPLCASMRCTKWKMHSEIRTLNFTHCLRFIALVECVTSIAVAVSLSTLLLLLLLLRAMLWHRATSKFKVDNKQQQENSGILATSISMAAKYFCHLQATILGKCFSYFVLFDLNFYTFFFDNSQS